jgi:ATP-dependent DNA helicase RecQ
MEYPMPSKKSIRRKISGPIVPLARLHAEARRRFGIEHFRPGQRETLEAIFQGRNVLALMPTGAGKSLCYQLPAVFLPGLVIVVSPLIALMRDQQEKAEEARIAAERVDSTLTPAESEETLDAIRSGDSKLIYVTPEQLENSEYVDLLARQGVSLLAVDEAHCISQWGHDFRPAYLNLRHAWKRLRRPPIAAFTATATEPVIQDILKALGAENALVLNTGTERDNLRFSVEQTANMDAKRSRLLELLADESGTGIVYTASVRSANELYEWLKGQGIQAGRYHAKLPARERAEVQSSFMAGKYKVLFATKAFGLGIDKPDIRFVYHYEFPDSLETYYQEAGRAGRDGKPARAVLLYRLEDRRIQRYFLLNRYPKVEESRRVLEAAAEPALIAELAERACLAKRRVQVIVRLLWDGHLLRRKCGGYQASAEPVSQDALRQAHSGYEEKRARDRQRIEDMMRYAESGQCRKQTLRTYFAEDAGEPCTICDNCVRGDSLSTATAAGTQDVIEIHTSAGPIVTTAPETLPWGASPRFRTGERVRHPKFGDGEVADSVGGIVLVRFEKGRTRKIQSAYVTSVDTASAG